MSEIALTLPDGSVRPFAHGATGADLAAAISRSLARQAVAVRVDGALCDLSEPFTEDASVEVVTRADADGLDLIRHDAAHALAEAAKELYPEVQITIGPVIENGFYYDFSRAEPFTPEDLVRLEERMREIVDRNEPIGREVWDRDEAGPLLRGRGRALQGPRSSARSRRTSRSRSTGRASSSISAGGRTCPPRASSARRSS